MSDAKNPYLGEHAHTSGGCEECALSVAWDQGAKAGAETERAAIAASLRKYTAVAKPEEAIREAYLWVADQVEAGAHHAALLSKTEK